MFASKTAESMNRDPHPWHEEETGLRFSDEGVAAQNERGRCWRGLGLDPRPEYTPETAHPANPILVAFRLHVANGPGSFTRSLAMVELNATRQGRGLLGNLATPAEIEHAQKVLTRLANLTKEQTQ